MSSTSSAAASATTTSEVAGASTSTFVTALVTAAITCGVCLGFWLIFRNRKNLIRVFQPRSVLAEDDKKEEPMPTGIFSFWKTVFKSLDDTEVLRLNGPDAYFFVRYLKVIGLHLMFPTFLITFAACIPAAAVQPRASDAETHQPVNGLNILTFGAVPTNIGKQALRHLAHFFVAVILMVYTLWILWREYHHFMDVRLNWLRSERGLTKSRTVALVNVPKDMMSRSGIKEIAGGVVASHGPRPSDVGTSAAASAAASAGGVTRVWLARKVKPVQKTWEERDKEVYRLEGGVGKLLKRALKNERKNKTPEAKGTWDPEGPNSAIERYVKPKKIPTWKQGFLGLLGKKMTLETSPVYIREHNEELDKLRANHDDYELGNVAFARFGTQDEAHNFARNARKSDKSLRMLDTKIEVVPEDIVWSNTYMNPYQRKVRTIASWSATIALLIFWSVIVGAVGSISNIDSLQTQKGFTWIANIPTIPKGIIKALLPTIVITILMMFLPIILRAWIKLQGEIRKSDIELKLFTRFWAFQYTNVFLIVTLASGFMAALGNLSGTVSEIPTLLAQKLPEASLFFLTYALVNSWAAAAKSLARIVPYVMWQLRGFLAGGTPRKAFTQKFKMDSFGWSTVWPPVCLLALTGIVYSVIQPMLPLIVFIGMLLFYMAYKYTLLWVANQDETLETGGLYYIKALRTVFVSLYTEQVCLAGLFFLETGPDGKRTTSGLACGAILVFVGVCTAVLQAYIDNVLYKRQTLMFGVRGNQLLSSSETQLTNNVEKVPSIDRQSEEGLDNEFEHPALYKKQPCVWICDDPLRIGRLETDRINADGVEASTEFAHMNEKADITVDRSPPDEPWDNREPINVNEA